MKLGRWSTTAGNNNTTPPDGWPEGQAPSTVNDCAREMMAAIRTAFADLQFFDQDLTPTYVSATQFSVAGDQTSAIHAGRRLKIYDATATVATTIYATVTTASFTAVTNIHISADAGQLTSSLSSFAMAILSSNNHSLPNVPASRISGTLAVANGGTGVNSVSAGVVLIGAGTAAMTPLSPSTSGNVMTSSGGTWISAAPPTGESVVSVTSAAAAASVTLAVPAGYDYRLRLDGVRSNTSASDLYVRVSTDNGASYLSTSYASAAVLFGLQGISATAAAAAVAIRATMAIGGGAFTYTFPSTAPNALAGEIWVLNPGGGVHPTNVFGTLVTNEAKLNSVSGPARWDFSGNHQGTATVTHVQIILSSGLLTGTIILSRTTRTA